MSVVLYGILVFCAVALVLVLVLNGWVAFVRPRRFRQLVEAGHVAEGVVVARPTFVLPGDPAVQSPDATITLIDVEYTDPAGVTHRVRSRGGTTRFPELGRRVRVAFDPAAPKRAMIEDDVRHARKICLLVFAIFTPMLIPIVLGLVWIDL